MLSAISNIKSFRDDPLLFTENLEQRTGAYARVKFCHRVFHFIYDADYAEHVLIKNIDIYKKSRLIFDQIIPITGKHGIVQLEGDEWAKWRALTSEIFSKHAFLLYPAVIEKYLLHCTQKLKEAANTNQPIDLSALFITYTIRTAVEILLNCHDEEIAARIAHDFIELNHLCGKRMRNFINLPYFIKTKENSAVINLSESLRRSLGELICAAWKMCEKKSLIGLLTRAFPQQSEDTTLFITDQLMTFLFAGFETTSASLTFCFYLLARFPDTQNSIRKEACELGYNGVLSLEAIKRYSYAAAVYKEALRLYPPAWIVAREASKNDNIGDQAIKVGDTVIVCIRQIHRNHLLWPRADVYQPERFYQTAPRLKKCAFMPFGVGPRTCSGAQLAMLEGVNAVVGLCTQFFFASDDNDIALKALVTLNPKEPVLTRVSPL